MNGEFEQRIRAAVEERETFEEKIEFLDDWEFDINMKDRWNDKDRMMSDVIFKVRMEIKKQWEQKNQ